MTLLLYQTAIYKGHSYAVQTCDQFSQSCLAGGKIVPGVHILLVSGRWSETFYDPKEVKKGGGDRYYEEITTSFELCCLTLCHLAVRS